MSAEVGIRQKNVLCTGDGQGGGGGEKMNQHSALVGTYRTMVNGFYVLFTAALSSTYSSRTVLLS
jgi:hypothetical protein